MGRAPRIAIIYYSVYGHILKMAEAEAEGIRRAGGSVDIFQVQETLPQNILKMIKAPPKSDKYEVLTKYEQIKDYDGFLFGIAARYANMSVQFKAFWDGTGAAFGSNAFFGKYAGCFVSTGTLGGGQETTIISYLSTIIHHGMNFVPLGYKSTAAMWGDMSVVRGGSPWGAGTLAASDGSRQPSDLELEVARIQGEEFYQKLKAVNFEWLYGGDTQAQDEKTNGAAASTGHTTNGQVNGQASKIVTGKDDKDGLWGLPIKCTIQ